MRLVYVAIGWSIGILLAANNPNSPSWVWLMLAAISCLMAWITRRDPLLRMSFIALTALMLGGWRIAIFPQDSDIAQYNNVGGLTLEGIVTEAPDIRDDRIQLHVEIESVTRLGFTMPSDGLVLVQMPRTGQDVRYGDRIQATPFMLGCWI
jgi:hypothetical protein